MITLKIEGMTCGHCVKAVVSLEQKQAVVSGDPKPDALVSAVEEAGYEARVA
jgi:copper chaperone CopZ